MPNEFVWMLHFNSKRPKNIRGKVLEVHRDNDIDAAGNRGCKDVPVIRVGEFESLYQRLVAFYQTLVGVGVHQLTGSFELVPA